MPTLKFFSKPSSPLKISLVLDIVDDDIEFSLDALKKIFAEYSINEIIFDLCNVEFLRLNNKYLTVSQEEEGNKKIFSEIPIYIALSALLEIPEKNLIHVVSLKIEDGETNLTDLLGRKSIFPNLVGLSNLITRCKNLKAIICASENVRHPFYYDEIFKLFNKFPQLSHCEFWIKSTAQGEINYLSACLHALPKNMSEFSIKFLTDIHAVYTYLSFLNYSPEASTAFYLQHNATLNLNLLLTGLFKNDSIHNISIGLNGAYIEYSIGLEETSLLLLAGLLPRYRSVTLFGLKIDAEGLNILSEAIRQNNNLRTLILQTPFIENPKELTRDQTSIQSLINAIKEKKDLQKIDISQLMLPLGLLSDLATLPATHYKLRELMLFDKDEVEYSTYSDNDLQKFIEDFSKAYFSAEISSLRYLDVLEIYQERGENETTKKKVYKILKTFEAIEENKKPSDLSVTEKSKQFIEKYGVEVSPGSLVNLTIFSLKHHPDTKGQDISKNISEDLYEKYLAGGSTIEIKRDQLSQEEETEPDAKKLRSQ